GLEDPDGRRRGRPRAQRRGRQAGGRGRLRRRGRLRAGRDEPAEHGDGKEAVLLPERGPAERHDVTSMVTWRWSWPVPGLGSGDSTSTVRSHGTASIVVMKRSG